MPLNRLKMGNPEQSIYNQFIGKNIDHYSKIENELSTMGDDDIQELLQYDPYVIANNALSLIIQGEMLRMVRLQVNQHYEEINNVVIAIQQFKKNKDKENREFQDYIKNYSHLSYNEYLKLKNENK